MVADCRPGPWLAAHAPGACGGRLRGRCVPAGSRGANGRVRGWRASCHSPLAETRGRLATAGAAMRAARGCVEATPARRPLIPCVCMALGCPEGCAARAWGGGARATAATVRAASGAGLHELLRGGTHDEAFDCLAAPPRQRRSGPREEDLSMVRQKQSTKTATGSRVQCLAFFTSKRVGCGRGYKSSMAAHKPEVKPRDAVSKDREGIIEVICGSLSSHMRHHRRITGLWGRRSTKNARAARDVRACPPLYSAPRSSKGMHAVFMCLGTTLKRERHVLGREAGSLGAPTMSEVPTLLHGMSGGAASRTAGGAAEHAHG